jgi:PAS domain S-box-containing protein
MQGVSSAELKLLGDLIDELVFVWALSGDLLWGNQAWQRETGFNAEDFGFGNEDNPFVVPDDLPQMMAEMTAFLESDAEVSKPIKNRFFDAWGQVRALSSVVVKVTWDGQSALLIVGTLLDKASAPLEAEQSYRQLVEAADDGIVKLAPGGRILVSNRRMQALAKMSIVQLGATPFAELFDAATREGVELALAGAHEGQATSSVRARLQGSGRWLDVKVTPIADARATATALAIARDVTDVRALEAQAMRQERESALVRLVSGIAHDLNNMVTGVLANSTFLESLEWDSPVVTETLKSIRLAGERAGEMGRSMLAYLGQAPPERRAVRFADAVRDTVRIVRPLVGSAINIRLQIPSHELTVRGDPGQLGQIVLNLLTNAAESLSEAGGNIDVELTDVELEGGQAWMRPEPLRAGSYVRLSVIDEGHGMDQETVERIFEPHFTTKTSGHGIGLSSMLGTLKEHQGGIRVTSRPGRGTRMDVYLPRVADAVVLPGRAASSQKALSRTRVLVVDDEAPIRLLVKRILERSGAVVLAAASGAEGLALFRQHGADAAIVDSCLHGEDGAELVRQLTVLEPDLPLLVSSGYLESQTGIRGSFLAKPYTAQQLVDAVRAVLRQTD